MSTYFQTPISAMMSSNYSQLLAFDPMRSFLARNLHSSNGQHAHQHSPPSPPNGSNISQLSPEAAATLAQMQSICGPKNYSLHRSMNGVGSGNGSPDGRVTPGDNGPNGNILSMAEMAHNMHKMMPMHGLDLPQGPQQHMSPGQHQHQQQQQQQQHQLQQQQHQQGHRGHPGPQLMHDHHGNGIGGHAPSGPPLTHPPPSHDERESGGGGGGGGRGRRGSSSDKDFLCESCGKRFTQKGNLKTHIRSVHTKEKPFCCPVCGKSFSQKGNMQTHVRTHNKDDRFPCNLCGKTFSQKGNLKTHMQRHAGTLPPSKRTGHQKRAKNGSNTGGGGNGSLLPMGGPHGPMGHGGYHGSGGVLDLGPGSQLPSSSPSHRSSSTDDDDCSSPMSDLALGPPTLIPSMGGSGLGPNGLQHSMNQLHQRGGPLIGPMGVLNPNHPGHLSTHPSSLGSAGSGPNSRSPLSSPGPDGGQRSPSVPSPSPFNSSPSSAAAAARASLYSSPSSMTPLAAHSWVTSAGSSPTVNFSTVSHKAAAAAAAAAAVAHQQHQARAAFHDPFSLAAAGHPYGSFPNHPLSRLSLFSGMAGMHPLGAAAAAGMVGPNGGHPPAVSSPGLNGSRGDSNNSGNNEGEGRDDDRPTSSRSNKSDSPTSLVIRPDSKW